jgi:uncharacterized protein (DUF169 family)
MHTSDNISEEDRQRAEQCRNCPVCQKARAQQRGLAFWFVKNVEGGRCPNCTSYAKVYGRPAHAPVEG